MASDPELLGETWNSSRLQTSLLSRHGSLRRLVAFKMEDDIERFHFESRGEIMQKATPEMSPFAKKNFYKWVGQWKEQWTKRVDAQGVGSFRMYTLKGIYTLGGGGGSSANCPKGINDLSPFTQILYFSWPKVGYFSDSPRICVITSEVLNL